MSCMCGDTHCSSCGPAQGNSRCPICRAWADDGCEHFDEETGKLKDEYWPIVARAAEAQLAAEEEAYQQFLADEEDAQKYWSGQ